MKKSLRRIAAAVIGLASVAALAALFFVVQGPQEPEWGGVKLSDWLQGRPFGDKRTALEAMSPQAFPYMLAMMRARDVRWKFQLAALLAKQNFVKFRLAPRASFRARFEAAEGFALLGTHAAPAVPGLCRLLRDRDTAGHAAYALLRIQTDDATQAVEHALVDRDTAVRQAVAIQIWRVGRDARRLLPAVLRGLHDTNSWVREYCARAMGRMDAPPSLAVPALIECLNDRSSDVSRAGADALLEFGNEARPAVPMLLEVVRQNDATRRAAALRALRKIDPDAAKLFPAD